MEYIDRKKRIVLISILLIFLFIILYIAIKGYGRIENLGTGRADIFNIGDGEKKDNNIIDDIKNNKSFENTNKLSKHEKKNEVAINKIKDWSIEKKRRLNDKKINKPLMPDNSNLEVESGGSNIVNDQDVNRDGMLKVYDNIAFWNSRQELKIFENPAFNFNNVIAPGSHNIYKFFINNNENFNIKYSMKFLENNDGFINMKFKLKKNGKYILGDDFNWSDINNKSIEENALEKNDYDVYLLEWKWLDGANDVKAGFNQSNYKLNIEIKAKS